jgi:DNA adenine methylase
MEHFPKKAPERYIEVFGGAGWILFSREQHAPLEVFNDLDGHLINLYRCVQHHCGELQRELLLGGSQIPPNSRELFFDYLAQLNVQGLTDIQRAARYFYVIRASFGADRRTFSCHKAALMSAIERLPEIQERLQNVVIENRDFELLMKTYDRVNALLYLDPPYYKAEKHYEGFSMEDHERLCQCTGKLKGSFVLSYNDDPTVRELYKGYYIHEVERSNCLASKKGKKSVYKELIITNFDLAA